MGPEQECVEYSRLDQAVRAAQSRLPAERSVVPPRSRELGMADDSNLSGKCQDDFFVFGSKLENLSSRRAMGGDAVHVETPFSLKSGDAQGVLRLRPWR